MGHQLMAFLMNQPKETYDALTGLGTIALAGITFLLMIGTAVLARYTYGLWRETKTLREDAAKDAQAQSENTAKALDIAEKQNLLSGLQADILEKQKEIARLEFFAAHRPKIIMRNVSMFIEEGEYKLIYTLVNIGGSDATITESWVMTEFVEKGKPIRNLRCAGHNDLGQVQLKAGENRDFTHGLIAEAHFQMALEEIRGPHDKSLAGFYFTGSLRYQDPMGPPRTSVFRRIYEAGAFRRTDDPDHEYSD